MKCSYCGHELADGAEFCDNCGMILGFGDEEKNEKHNSDAENDILQYTPNVFQAIDLPDEEEVSEAAELPVSDIEETVEVTHNIPEYVSLPDVPAYESEKAVEEAEEALEKAEKELSATDDDTVIEEEFLAPEYTPVPDVVITAKKPSENKLGIRIPEAESKSAKDKKLKNKKKQYKETYSIESIPLNEKPSEPEIIRVAPAAKPVEEAEPAKTDEPIAEVKTEVEIEAPVVEEISEIEAPAAEIATETESAALETEEVVEPAEEVIEPQEDDVIAVGLFEDISSGAEIEEDGEYEDITPKDDDDLEVIDSYVKPKKKGGKGLVAAVIIVVLCVLAVGAYALKDVIPVALPGFNEETTTQGSAEETTEEDTTEETTEEDTTEETTQAETTEGEETTADETTDVSENEITTTEKETTTKETTTEERVTTEPSASQNAVVTTTKPTTTKPTTTKPTTTRPTTTKPTTTRPTTTKPTTTKPDTTTDPYGINNITVKKPSSYIKSYTGYVTAEGVNLRSGPSTRYDRVLYLSKGADIKVLAKEGAFLYVYSNRYGVYGWVSASYVSTSRPEAETSKVHSGTVKPDVTTKSKTMYTTYSVNIRKGPSTSYDSVQIIATGYPVKVTGYKNGVSGWVYVTDLTYGISGWVSSAYLK